MPSCIGSFGLWSSLKDWNNNIGNKFVNEIVFLLCIPYRTYEVALLGRRHCTEPYRILSGSNPWHDVGSVKTVAESGEYLVNQEDGYTITTWRVKKTSHLPWFMTKKRIHGTLQPIWTDYNERRRNYHFQTAGRHLGDCISRFAR